MPPSIIIVWIALKYLLYRDVLSHYLDQIFQGGNRIVMKFCLGVGVPDIITHANLGDNWFRGFRESGGRISHFSIDLCCRL